MFRHLSSRTSDTSKNKIVNVENYEMSGAAISHGELLHLPAAIAQNLTEVLLNAKQTSTKGITYIQSDGIEFQSYLELRETATKILVGLKQLGLKSKDKVILQLEQQDFIEAFWACILGGFVPVPLATAPIYEPDNSASKKLHNAWQILDKPLVLTNEKLAAPIRNLAVQLQLELKLATLNQLSSSTSKSNVDYHLAKPEDIALMLLTSGSTGVPKTVKLSHQNILNSIAATSQIGGFTSQDISLNWLPLDHPGPLIRCVIRMVYLGCQQLHAPTATVLQDPLKWLDWLDRYRVTTTWAPNFAFALLNDRAEEIKQGHWDLTSIKSWLNTAEPIVPQTAMKSWELLNPHGLSKSAMHSSWGMAETSSGVTYSKQYLSELASDRNDSFAELGLPVPGVALRIVDERDRIVTEQTIGFLQVKGATVTSGYEQNPEANREAFTADGWFKTGDLGFLDRGRLTITGRIKDVIIINGNNFYSHEIEGVVEEIEGVEVSYTAACGIRQPNSNTDRLAIFFHTIISEDEALLELLKKIQQHIVRKLGINPAYLIPVEPEAIPKTSIGKIQRSQLKQRFEAGEFEPIVNRIDTLLRAARSNVEQVAPRTELERQLVSIWQQVLNVPTIGIHDNFFELGGHSILVFQTISRVREELEIELPIQYLFQAPTIGQLSESIERGDLLKVSDTPSTAIPVRGQAQAPLSYVQQGLWFLDRLEGQNATYNIPLVLRLTGSLDRNCLQLAIATVIERHEALRTKIITVEGIGQQEIVPTAAIDLNLIDLREFAPGDRHLRVIQLAKEEARLSFDLTQAPLIRAKLLYLADNSHVLLLTVHHVVADGWSMNVLVDELWTIYQGLMAQAEAELEPLPIQYADFALWQREHFNDVTLAPQLEYWQNQLAGIPPILELPLDRLRPAKQTFAGSSQPFQLSQELTDKLQALSQRSGTTLYMTVLAAFGVLMHRYSHQSDIVIGSPIANRNYHEVESLIGFFVNTLALRLDLANQPSFTALLQQVRQVTLDAYAHQDVPFSKVVEQLELDRNLSHHPIFQVMFTWQNIPDYHEKLGDLSVKQIRVESVAAKFDLDVSFVKSESGLEGTFTYNTDLFDAATIERMTANFQTLLAGIINNPQQHITQLPLLAKAEQHQLLEWNNTQVDYPQEGINKLFELQVEKTPDAVAVVFENEALTYRQLNQKANQLAYYLQTLKVDSGMLVGICIEPSLEQVVSLLGVLKANGVYVPLDPNYPQERLAFMLEDSKVQIVLTQQSLTEKISARQAQIVCLDLDKDAIAEESGENLNLQTTLDDLAYAIYTSGSTGKPKAVLGKTRGIVNRLHWMWSTLPFAVDEVCCQKTSIAFVDHVAEIFSPLLKGIPLVIVRDRIRSDVPQLMNLLSEQKISRIVLVPSLLKVMLDSEPQQLTQLQALKYVFCSGEALPLRLAETFHQKLSSARLFNIYGSSEVAADVTCFEVNFWETHQRILQYFKPEVVCDGADDRVLGVYQKPFTKPGVSPEMLATKFQRSELPLNPVTVDDYQDKFAKEVLPYTIDTASPTFIGHMTSALPDFMHDMSKMISQLNQNLVKIETSKSLIFLEREAIAMLHRLVYGLSSEFYAENIQQKNHNLGIVTTGGTTANISALLCARNSRLFNKEESGELSKDSLYKVLNQKGYHDIAIVGSRLMHYSVNKAASILGLGTDNIIFVDSNNEGNLDLHLLKEKIRECEQNKLYILALVGIAGTTETGEIDPLEEMGKIAQEFGIHFHVDGAWGGATMFSDKHQVKLKGIEQADSVTICGHKQLYLPQGISVCLFKDPQLLNSAATTARYQAQQDTFDVGRFTIEGSRSAISLCLHGALHIIGKKGYELLINNGIEKAQYFAQLIELLEPFQLLMPPALNIVNYRYIPADLRDKAQQKSLSDRDIQRIDLLNTQIQQEQFEQGMTFVSKTTLIDTAYDREIVVFRTVLSNPNTTATDLQTVLEDQLRIANQIETRTQERSNSVKGLVTRSSNVSQTAIVRQEAIHLQLADELKADLEEYLQKNTVSIGKPIANTQIYILDKYGNLVPQGITGEIYVGGDGLAQGYLDMPELTKQRFILNPANNNQKSDKAEDRLYKTGDLARWLPNGNIEFLGRIDNQVKIRGFRIELGEIEAVLTQHPNVSETVVIAREDIPGDKRLVAYVTQQQQPNSSDLRSFLQERLPNYMVPSAFVFLDTMPLNPNGKLDRRALPAPDESSIQSATNFVPPSNPTEETLATIWSDVLGIEKIGIHDRFFELGGHSLLATTVVSRIDRAFGVELTIRNIFETPTIAGLSLAVTQSQSEQTEDEDIADLLTELEGLTDEEVQQLLTEEMQ